MISTDNNSYGGSSTDIKVVGTTDELAIDTFIVDKISKHVDIIRIGHGESRSFELVK